MDVLLAKIYDGFLEDDSYPYHIYVYFDKIDDVECGARFDMRSDNMISFLIYSKYVYDSENDPLILYRKTYIVSEKELSENRLDKEKIKKYTTSLLEDIPRLVLSTMGSLELKEETEVLDAMNEFFIGMPNVTYAASKCHTCEKKTMTKTSCCKTHLCYKCWKIECPNCEKTFV